MDTLTLAASLVLLLLAHLPGAVAGSRCTSYSGFSTYSQYCTYGCCNSGSSSPCCSYYYSSYYNSFWSAGVIVGIVFGCLVGIAFLVCLIVLCASFCCKTTRVVNPQPVTYTGGHVHVFQTNTSATTGASGARPVQPPPYGAYGQGLPPYGQNPPPDSSNPKGQPPPAYNYTNPAFPPASTSFNHPPPAPANPFAEAANSATNS